MASLDQILENPYWRKMYRYAMKSPNDGHYKRWIQGSVGMMSPMFLYSNEYSYLRMKHGQNNLLSYRGNVKKFTHSVDDNLKRQVDICSKQTLNPAGCQTAAIRKAYSHDASMGYNTPHPFNVSYKTGYPTNEVYIPPNSPYQD